LVDHYLCTSWHRLHPQTKSEEFEIDWNTGDLISDRVIKKDQHDGDSNKPNPKRNEISEEKIFGVVGSRVQSDAANPDDEDKEVSFEGRCLKVESKSDCHEEVKKNCEASKKKLCHGEGECVVSDTKDGCCFRIKCPMASVTEDRCHDPKPKDNCEDDFADDCIKEKLDACGGAGECVHFMKRSQCCYKISCDESKSTNDTGGGLEGGGTVIKKVEHPRDCNRDLCPRLPDVCPKEGACIVKSLCENRENCSCKVEVKCFSNAKHIFEIEYEFEGDNVTTTALTTPGTTFSPSSFATTPSTTPAKPRTTKTRQAGETSPTTKKMESSSEESMSDYRISSSLYRTKCTNRFIPRN